MARRRRPPPASGAAPAPPATPPSEAPASTRATRLGRSRRLEAVPVWLQAVAAVLGVVLTALALFGVVRGPGPEATSRPGPGATDGARSPAVTLRSVITSGNEIRGTGDFRDVDPGIESVLFIGQPADAPQGPWLPVVASLSFDATQPTGRRNGNWLGVRPVPPAQPYVWYAVVAPTAVGAEDGYADLRIHGPDSGLVKAKSEPQTTH